MEHPVRMEIEESIQELEQYRLDCGCRYWMSTRLCVVMYDLKKIMLSIFEDHEDTFVFKDGLHKMDHVWVRQFGA